MHELWDGGGGLGEGEGCLCVHVAAVLKTGAE